MTSGVAPRASIACTLLMQTESTTLSEFDDGGTDEGDDVDATPEENATDIQHLIGLVGSLTDQVDHLADRLEQRETSGAPHGDGPESPAADGASGRDPNTTTERMYQ